MGINVIQQSTSERYAEIKHIFDECVPLLDEGYSLRQAAIKVTGQYTHTHKRGWFKFLVDYAESQGYDYHNKKWRVLE